MDGKATIFNESEIARQLNQVNDKIKQLICRSVYLRVENEVE